MNIKDQIEKALDNPQVRASIAEALSSTTLPMDKMSKDEANYRKAENDGPKPSCGYCDHFSNDQCSIVAGNIKPDYLCDYYDGESPERSGEQDSNPDD